MEYREGNETKKKKWNIEKEMKHREENGIYGVSFSSEYTLPE